MDVVRAVRSLAEAMGVDADAESVPDLLARNTEPSTPEPEVEPVEDHSAETTREPDDLLYL